MPPAEKRGFLSKLCGCFSDAPKPEPKPAPRPAPAGAPRKRPSQNRRQSIGDPAERYGVKSQFQAIKFAGKGAAGDVWVCRDLRTQEVVAIKFMKRPISSGNMPLVARELKIHSLLSEGHVNVIKAYDALLTTSHLGLIMEYAGGGNLTSYVGRKSHESKTTGLYCSEDEAKFFFRQFISAVNYCHQHCVAHRDLKLDNVLLDGSDPPVLKLTDFGFAKTWTGMARNTTRIGTPVYMSPELINADREANYDPKSVDVWASGILLIVMLLGAFPFDHTTNPDPNTFEAQYEVWQQEVTEKWHESKYIAGRADKLSAGCRDLLDRIFIVDPMKRISIKEIMGHEWYNDPLPERFQRVMDQLERDQRELDDVMRERDVDQDLVDQRNEALDFLVREAGRRATQGTMGDMSSLQIVDYRRQDIKHVNLSMAAILKGSSHDYAQVLQGDSPAVSDGHHKLGSASGSRKPSELDSAGNGGQASKPTAQNMQRNPTFHNIEVAEHLHAPGVAVATPGAAAATTPAASTAPGPAAAAPSPGATAVAVGAAAVAAKKDAR